MMKPYVLCMYILYHILNKTIVQIEIYGVGIAQRGLSSFII